MKARPRGNAQDSGGRERLLAAAAKLFATRGYAATSVRVILTAAKVTAPVLYYHFGSKEGLFVALIRDALADIDSEVERAMARRTTATDKVWAFCCAHVATQQRYTDLLWVAEALIGGNPEVAPRFDIKTPFANMVESLAGLVSEAVDAREFRPCDPTEAALVLMGAVQMATRLRLIQAYLPGPAIPPQRVLGTALDGFRVARQPSGAGRPKSRNCKTDT